MNVTTRNEHQRQTKTCTFRSIDSSRRSTATVGQANNPHSKASKASRRCNKDTVNKNTWLASPLDATSAPSAEHRDDEFPKQMVALFVGFSNALVFAGFLSGLLFQSNWCQARPGGKDWTGDEGVIQ